MNIKIMCFTLIVFLVNAGGVCHGEQVLHAINTKFHDDVINLEDKIDRMDYKSAHNILSPLADKMGILLDEVDK